MLSYSRMCVVWSICVLIAAGAGAQTPSRPQPKIALPPGGEEATQLLQQGKATEALAAFEKLAKENPKSGPTWLWLGRAAAASNNYPRAVQAFEKGVAIDSNPTSIYNAGASHARLGHTDKALLYLKLAVRAGLPVNVLRTDSDLDGIRADPRFKEILAAAAKP